MTQQSRDVQAWIEGALLGVIAWILGYGITFALVAPRVRERPIHRIVEALEGEPATYELVGWVFLNAHFVQTVFRNVPLIGTFSTTFIGNDGFGPSLYVIPVIMLVLAGMALAYHQNATSPVAGARAGLGLLPGYALPSVISVFVFEVTIAGARGSPDLLPAIVLAGIAYPIVVGIGSATITGALMQRSSGVSA